MKITSVEFVASAVDEGGFPRDGLPEIVLMGKSNVGKSSLINTFLGRKKLAKTSSQPGKTRTINFYRVNNSFYLVDLPGYGFAKVPLSEKNKWKPMVERYIRGREAIKGGLLLLDPRRDLGRMEHDFIAWLEELDVATRLVFTKSDKLSRNQMQKRLSAIRKSGIASTEGAVLFSSLKGDGKEALGRVIYSMVNE